MVLRAETSPAAEVHSERVFAEPGSRDGGQNLMAHKGLPPELLVEPRCWLLPKVPQKAFRGALGGSGAPKQANVLCQKRRLKN